MTDKMPPGAPKLTWTSEDGDESESGPGDTLSDSSWEEAPQEPDNTRKNLKRIARKRTGK